MSRVLWIDASVGVAGDMLMAALFDAGASVEAVRAGLNTLDLPGWSVQPKTVHRGAFRALYAGVTVDGETPDPHAGPADGVPGPSTSTRKSASTGHTHTHIHAHTHTHDGHAHAHHGATGHPGDGHRAYNDVLRILNSGALPERAKKRALAVYERLAHAEARMHGMAIEDVVLHEVGAVDAIVDIVGCCLAMENLGIDHIVATPLPMGTGSVISAHGIIPLPAPATLSICQGFPVVESRWPGEWVTPTGAALVCTLAKPGGVPAMTPVATGYGAGRKDPPQVANLVRVVVGESVASTAADDVLEVACTVDDMLGEHIPAVIDAVMTAGAVDAWVTPVLMKKGRPGYTLHALCPVQAENDVADALLRHTSSLGVRVSAHHRHVLDRWHDTVHTAFGDVRVKVGGRGHTPWHASPEHADVARVASENGVSERTVYDAAIGAWTTQQP